MNYLMVKILSALKKFLGVKKIEAQNLTNHILEFCFYLRERGFLIGPQETSEGLLAMKSVDVADRDSVQTSLRLVLCSRVEELPIFDHAFQEFFLHRWAPDREKEMLHYLSQKKQSSRSIDEGEQVLKSEDKKRPALLSSGSYIAGNHVADSDGQPSGKMPVWLASLIMNQADKPFEIPIRMDEYEGMAAAARLLVKKMKKNIRADGSRLEKERGFIFAGRYDGAFKPAVIPFSYPA